MYRRISTIWYSYYSYFIFYNAAQILVACRYSLCRQRRHQWWLPMPFSLSLVNRTIDIRRDPMVPNIFLMLARRAGVVTLSMHATSTMLIGWVTETRYACLLMNIMSQCMCWSAKLRRVTDCWIAGIGFDFVVRSFKAATFGPQIVVARLISSGKISQLRNAPAFNAEISFASGGKPRLAWNLRASMLLWTSRFEYSASFSAVVICLEVYKDDDFGVRTVAAWANACLRGGASAFRSSGVTPKSATHVVTSCWP